MVRPLYTEENKGERTPHLLLASILTTEKKTLATQPRGGSAKFGPYSHYVSLCINFVIPGPWCLRKLDASFDEKKMKKTPWKCMDCEIEEKEHK
ncbi:hypothetical protein ES288_A10G284600v1 [Gossypium darwinii]|uniref:Uncharacterized protein n=1 Tax=Gossypium darwinii TaxID=34276 RepID=A0A5D2F5P5_GOSDA|nr:hypothetical protein ES288_A10G284600v1 [Gossypium darwinii]